jgi:hypothetical protein
MGRSPDYRLWTSYLITDDKYVTRSQTTDMWPKHKPRAGHPITDHRCKSLEHRSFMENPRYFSHNRKVTRITTFFKTKRKPLFFKIIEFWNIYKDNLILICYYKKSSVDFSSNLGRLSRLFFSLQIYFLSLLQDFIH